MSHHTIDSLKAQRAADVGASPDTLEEISRDEAAGTASWSLPALAIRRTLAVRIDPPEAFIDEAPVDVDAVMSAEVGSAGDTAKATTREVIKVRYGVSSNAEADRRVYAFAAAMIGL